MMKAHLITAVFCLVVSITKADEKNASIVTNRNVQMYKHYEHMDIQLKRLVDKLIKKALPYILEASEHVNISSTCMENLFHLLSGIRKLTDWSFSFLDATGKPQSGIFTGNIQMFGESNQCLNTMVKKKDKVYFQGQYCSITVKPFLPDPVYYHEELGNITQDVSSLMKKFLSNLYFSYISDARIGVCVPSGCCKADISKMVAYLLGHGYINASVSYCVKKDDMKFWTHETIATVCVFCFLGVLLITSTILDNTSEKWKTNNIGLASRILQCFSITRNFPKLINTEHSEDQITCFHGLRVLSIFWVILCHEYLMQVMGHVGNHSLDMLPWMKKFFSQFVLNGFTAIEVFFFLGGFLNCYTRVKLQKSGKPQPSFWKIIIHRLWRIYPTLIVGFLTATMLKDTGAPFYEIQKETTEVCRKNWWKNLLFINNFYNPLSVCLPYTWYLCADMQIFLLSLITVPVLLRNEKFGMYLHFGVAFMAIIATFCLWWIGGLSPNFVILPLGDIPKLNRNYIIYQLNMYMLPLSHIASYCIGIILGYVVASKKVKTFSKTFTSIGWLVAIFLYLFNLFLTYWFHSRQLYTKFESSLYGSLSNSILLLPVGWMVYGCITNQARFINYILSLKIWTPVSRLTFMLYIVSFNVQSYFYYNLNFPADFNNMNLVWSYLGNLSVSLLLSLVLVLLVESPLLALEKVIFRRNQIENKSSAISEGKVTVKEIHGLKNNVQITSINF